MNILEVSQVNRYIKEVLSSDILLRDVWVKGEMSNFKYHSSGHMYFTLKDEYCVLKCVMFRTQCMNLKFLPANGMKIIIRGNVNVFERDGQYQLYCEEMTPDGLGALYLAFEQLKRKLEQEGLFSPLYKKTLPFFPTRIGVVTSRTGAVIRDIINVSIRRFPNVKITLYPVAVQGSSAAQEISSAIRTLNRIDNIDVLIVARGGGSLEELWAFNQEEVARAIFESNIPVVSAVGHETDFTIADMVADLRAPTPSAAAELVVPDIKELTWKIGLHIRRMVVAIETRLSNAKAQLKNIENSLPFRLPFDKIYQLRMIVDLNQRHMNRNASIIVKSYREKLSSLAARLNSLSPLAVLSRGYCLTSEYKSNRSVKSIEQLKIDMNLKLNFVDGTATCRVNSIQKGNIDE